MLNTKYSKVLSIILAIAIIAIIGLLIYMGINFYKTISTENETKDFFEQFNSYIEGNNSENKENNDNTNNESNSVINNTENETLINSEIINEEISNENNNNNSNSNNNDKDLTINGMQGVGIIEIPKTNIKYAILNDSSSKALDKGIAILYGPGVNKIGNTVLAGHNYRNGTFFSNNKKLAVGDKIYITDTSGKKVTYVIYKKYQTDANDFSYATRDTEGKREISLTTCTDDSSARIIIWAKEG